MSLAAPYSEPGGPSLVSQLNQTKGRLKPVGEDYLDGTLIDYRIRLEENFKKKIFVKILSGPQRMDPSTLIFRVRS